MSTFSDTLKRRNLVPPLLYGISNRLAFPDLALAQYLELLFATPAHILQWREKDLTLEENRALVRQGCRLARERGKIFLVSTCAELAASEGADGVHLPAREPVPQSVLRSSDGERLIVGKSVHSFREAVAAEEEGADYVLLGPVLEPISKTSSRPLLGFNTLKEVAQALYIPVVAVGGLGPGQLKIVQGAGAVAAAGISWMRDEVARLARVQPPSPNSPMR